MSSITSTPGRRGWLSERRARPSAMPSMGASFKAAGSPSPAASFRARIRACAWACHCGRTSAARLWATPPLSRWPSTAHHPNPGRASPIRSKPSSRGAISLRAAIGFAAPDRVSPASSGQYCGAGDCARSFSNSSRMIRILPSPAGALSSTTRGAVRSPRCSARSREASSSTMRLCPPSKISAIRLTLPRRESTRAPGILRFREPWMTLRAVAVSGGC